MQIRRRPCSPAPNLSIPVVILVPAAIAPAFRSPLGRFLARRQRIRVSLGRVFGREPACLGDLIPVDLRAIAARRALDGFGPVPITAGPHRLIHGARIMRLRGRHGGVLPRARILLGRLGGGNGLLRRAADRLLGRPLTGLVLRVLPSAAVA